MFNTHEEREKYVYKEGLTEEELDARSAVISAMDGNDSGDTLFCIVYTCKYWSYTVPETLRAIASLIEDQKVQLVEIREPDGDHYFRFDYVLRTPEDYV